MTFEVVTFVSENDGALARIRMPVQGAKGKTVIDWSPVVVHAPTAEEAKDKATAFYWSEFERLRTKDQNLAEGRAKAALSREAKKEKTS